MLSTHKCHYIIPIILAFAALLIVNSDIVSASSGDTPADTGDIAWICCSSVLVFLMIPGLALF